MLASCGDCVCCGVNWCIGGKDGALCHSPRGYGIHVKMVFASLCDRVSLRCSGASLCSGFNLGAVG